MSAGFFFTRSEFQRLSKKLSLGHNWCFLHCVKIYGTEIKFEPETIFPIFFKNPRKIWQKVIYFSLPNLATFNQKLSFIGN